MLIGVDFFLDGFDLHPQFLVRLTFILNLVGSVDNGGMVSSSQQSSDGLKSGIRHILAEIHGDLPRFGDGVAPGF